MSLYLALGDSITAGYGVESRFSFPALYTAFLQRHNSDLRMNNLGVDGLTTSGLLNMLQNNHHLRHLVAEASLITITIGSNDLLNLIGNRNQIINPTLVKLALNGLKKNLMQIGEAVRQLNPSTTVKVATLYNPLPAGPYAQYSEQAQGVLEIANSVIVTWSRRYGAVTVHLGREFRGKERLFIGQDFVHPNAAGYQRIAKAFGRS